MDKDKKTTASDVLFGNVYQISEDMIQATYRLLREISKFENVFSQMSQKLETINGNFNKYVVKKDWIKPSEQKRCQSKIAQSEELIYICREYSKSCYEMANNIISITEKFESNKKIKNIIKNLIDKIEAEENKIKEQEDKQEEKDKEEDKED